MAREGKIRSAERKSLGRNGKQILLLAGLAIPTLAQFPGSVTQANPTTFVTLSLPSTNPTTVDNSNASTTKFALLPSSDPDTPIAASASSTRAVQSLANDFTSFATPAFGFEDGSDLLDTSHDSRDGSSGINKLYFIFLAVSIVSLLLGLWFLKRRRRRMKAAFARYTNEGRQTPGQSRDPRRQPSTRSWRGAGAGRTNSSRRRWMQGGAPWHNSDRTGNGNSTSRDEGLNELGEAPPAYVKELEIGGMNVAPSVSVTNAQPPLEDENRRPTELSLVLQTPAIPMRTFSRNENDRGAPPYLFAKPPDYETAINSTNVSRSSSDR